MGPARTQYVGPTISDIKSNGTPSIVGMTGCMVYNTTRCPSNWSLYACQYN